jgi:hypothetical protein
MKARSTVLVCTNTHKLQAICSLTTKLNRIAWVIVSLVAFIRILILPDLQHHLCRLTLHGKSHLAPIKPDLQNVLDFGTGTGIWAIEFAEEYPSANVLGTDLSPIRPQLLVPSPQTFYL